MQTKLLGLFVACLPSVTQAQTLDAAPTSTIRASNPGPSDHFGIAVDSDGNWVVVGAPLDDNAAGNDAGSAYVYSRFGEGWSSPQTLTPSTADDNAEFGAAVAIHDDVLVVGAPLDDVPAGNSGRVFIWVRPEGQSDWVELPDQTLEHPSAVGSARFGQGVAVDGERIVVGAAGEASATGTVWIFLRDRNNTPDNPLDDTWSLAPSSPVVADPPDALSDFGYRVEIEGDVLAIGAPFDDLNGTDSGAVFVYEVQPDGAWQQEQKFSGNSGGDWFGWGLDLHQGTIVVGLPFSDLVTTNAGLAVVIEEIGAWVLTGQLFSPSQQAGDQFGSSVAIDSDRIAVGLNSADASFFGDAGSTLFFRKTAPFTWTEGDRVWAFDPRSNDVFGSAMAMSGDDLFIGAHLADEQATNAGRVYSFTMTEGQFEDTVVGDGSGAACPCTNDSLPGIGQGCVNSSGYGARLAAFGSDQAMPDGLRFSACNLPLFQPALLYSGETDLNPGVPFGDGLRASGPFNVRFNIVPANAEGFAFWGPGLASLPPNYPWLAGTTLYFQVWHRDPFNSPCGLNSSGFNFSNGVAVTFQ